MKKILTAFAAAVIMLCGTTAFANIEDFSVGTYYQLGRYDNNPILWRCVSTDDENGILMVSDKILCFKAANAGENKEDGDKYTELYGSNFWEETTIRQWLNSTAEAGDIEWLNYPPDTEHLKVNGIYGNYPYDDEAGFLSDTNFSESERSVMKTVNQWVALPDNKLDLSTNGISTPFVTFDYSMGNWGDSSVQGGSGISGFPDAYYGAMYRVSDTMFLLNECQVKEVRDVYDTAGAKSLYVPIKEPPADGEYYNYWLICPWTITSSRYNTYEMHVISFARSINSVPVSFEYGIRPAFYLNENTAYIVSGSGTEEDPYILDGTSQDGITVYANGEQVDFSVEPIIENDRTLVEMRAVFEMLGADVEWDDITSTVTAVSDDITVTLQTDNDVMIVNDEEVQLDTPAKIIDDHIMIPIRAVSEALNAKVDWHNDLRRVVIDKDPVWQDYGWYPDWYR
ncbi:MAG: copper amine oxidase N-terminal domain-containing protein, partial [Firmicutes bacterium]|nr:copper amine oxidase N-terminal domain-containing protein [Bacillota bacterium]